MAGLLDQALSPISNYGQGLLNLALQRKAREQQLADREVLRRQQLEDMDRAEKFALSQETSRRTFDVERENNRFAHEEAMVGLHAVAAKQQAIDQFNMLNEAQKKQKLEDAKAEAQGAGVKLPADVTYGDVVEAMSKSRGRQLIEAAKTAAEAFQQYAAARDQTYQEAASSAMSQAVAQVSQKDLDKAGLTQSDLAKLVVDPQSIADMRIKALRANNKKASALINQINATFSQQVEAGMASLEKSKPYLVGLSERFRLGRENYEMLAKKGGYDEPSGLEASRQLIQNVFQPASTKGAPTLPPPPRRTGSQPTGAAPAPQPTVRSQIPQLLAQDPYGTLKALMQQEQAGAVPGVNPLPGQDNSQTPLTNAWRDYLAQASGIQPSQIGSSVFTRSAGAQLMQNPQALAALDAWTPTQANQAAFKVLGQFWNSLPQNSPTRLRLEKYLTDQAAARAAATPTAFPPVTGMPGAPDNEAPGFE